MEGPYHHIRSRRSTKAVGTIAETFPPGIKPTEVVVDNNNDNGDDDNNDDNNSENDGSVGDTR